MTDQHHSTFKTTVFSVICLFALANIGACSDLPSDGAGLTDHAGGSIADARSTAETGGSRAGVGGSTVGVGGSIVGAGGSTTDAGSIADAGGAGADAGGSVATEMGLTQYAGQITPYLKSQDGDMTTYRFEPKEGPVCMRGDEFRVFVRDVGSKDLVIFQQDGGVCWSEFCFAVNKAPAKMPRIDILDPALVANPAAHWNHVFVPYCDGSFFSGDVEYADNLNNRGIRYHHGLANITAALEATKMRFPSPDRILLAGSSGGGYGLLLSGFLTRHYFPDAELILMADSGIGIARDNEPQYLQAILDEFNVRRFIPDNCANCANNGHFTGLLGYLLERDSKVRVGMYSSWYDSILASLYLRVSGERFATGLQQQTDRLHAAHPNRFRRFINDGIQHTALVGKSSAIFGTNWGSLEMPQGVWGTLLSSNVKIGKLNDTRIDGLSMAVWLEALINNQLSVWLDVQQVRGRAPDAK